jgi:hypothetical protein
MHELKIWSSLYHHLSNVFLQAQYIKARSVPSTVAFDAVVYDNNSASHKNITTIQCGVLYECADYREYNDTPTD